MNLANRFIRCATWEGLAIGPQYPVLIKINSEDFLDGGMTREEAVQVSGMLEKASVDAIELSGGTVASPQRLLPPRPGKLETPEQEVYYREAARRYKQEVKIPLMLVGGGYPLLWRGRGVGPGRDGRLHFHGSAADLRTRARQALAGG
jgi:2,4-dienoyl-CoA reductase-like NADH-dependent reductase (Old Yellow Enzyme family)